MVTPPQMTTVQLKLAGVGCGAEGKQSMTSPRLKNTKARALTKIPAAPIFQRGCLIGLLESRFASRQAIDIQYELKIAMDESDVMILKAITEPSGIKERREMTMKVTKTELRGIWVEVVTWAMSEWDRNHA